MRSIRRSLKKALQAVAQQDPHTLPPGKYTVDGDNLFFTVVEGQTRPLSEQRPEFHRQYIDIHIVLAGVEIIGAGQQRSADRAGRAVQRGP
ncbi:Toxin-antitoxin biofilm protein TabA [Raoultella ornithinolytica]|nr:Toxin-antitoxin biofilm protein TabA [Raoultella ornithinolytica]